MNTKDKPELELAPDAWKRFERAVDVVAKSPPQPRKGKSKPTDEPADLIEGDDTSPEAMEVAELLGNKK